MKLKIFIKITIVSLFITVTYATSDDDAMLATKVTDFVRRPVLHNFIQDIHENDRWELWGATTSRTLELNSAKATALESQTYKKTCRYKTTRAPNFILPGFGGCLDSFFLHDSAGTERCEDAIRVENFDLDGIATTYLSVAYCLGLNAKTFILGSERASIVHIYKYVNNALSCTYTALCPVRADFGCCLNSFAAVRGREKEIIRNDKVAQSPCFDEERYSLDFIREYLRQAAHIMVDTKEDVVSCTEVHEDYFCHYDSACHMVKLASGLSHQLYRRGLFALRESSAMLADESLLVSGSASDTSISSDESDVSTSSHKGRSTKECAGQIMRVCAFSTEFLITSWNKRDIRSILEQWGIDVANGICIVDEKRSEFSLIKRLRGDFTGVIPYFFDNDQLFKAIYERKLNYSGLLALKKSTKRKRG